MSVSEPGKIITPWAQSGLKNPIPPAANPATGRAGFDQGFSAINMTAKEAGGIPPFGQDFNGIFYEVTNILRYMQAGGQPTFDTALATAIGGYPKGAMVLGSDGVTLWQSKVDSNFTDPNTDPSNWGTFDIGLKADLAAPGGAELVGGVSIPAASQEFAGGMLPTNLDNKAQAISVFNSGNDVRIDSGTYLVSGAVISKNADKVSVRGVPGDTEIKLTGSGTLLSIENAGPVSVQDINLDMSQPPTASTTHGIAVIDISDLVLSGLNIKGLDGIGSGIISYPSTDTQIRNARLSDINIEGDRTSSTNTNGFVLVNTGFSHVSNVKVSGVEEFALELKNDSEHNIITSSSAENCGSGLYYGSSDVGKNPRYNIAAGIIAKDCDVGYTPGLGTDNVLSGALLDMRGTVITSSTAAARIGSASSAIFGAHFVGAGDVVRYDAEAKNNYSQVSCHPTSALFGYVVHEAGSERNALEISHPGPLNNSIIPNISLPAGTAVSGGTSNPVWCHPTGEYIGSLGTGWLWRHGVSGVARSPTHKWRFEGAGDSLLSIAIDGVGVGGISVNTPVGQREFTWNETSQFWQVYGGTYNVRFYNNTIRPGADNTMDFGTAALRGRVAYFATGTINTSDAREKTAPLAISDAVLDAWGDVQLITFQWLESIRVKGEDAARWHFGVIAQQVRDAFTAHGLDGAHYGLLCYDEWEDELEPVMGIRDNPTTGEPEEYTTGEMKTVLAAGNRWGIRPDQCLFIEAAYQRRRCDRIEARLAALEA